MKKQTELRKQANPTNSGRQRETGEKRRWANISEEANRGLNCLVEAVGFTKAKVVNGAICSYLYFVEKFPDTAYGQTSVAKCDYLLELPRGNALKRIDQLIDRTELISDQVINSAIITYVKYANNSLDQIGTPMIEVLRKDPGGMDPEQVAGILSMPNESTLELFERITLTMKEMPFRAAVLEAKGMVGMIVPHPGFESARVALQMIVEGAERLDRCLRWNRTAGRTA